MQYRGGVQYRVGYAVLWGCTVPWGDIMMHMGDILSTVGDIMMHVGDILSTVEVFRTVGESHLLFEYSTVLNTPHGTHDIPTCINDNPTVLKLQRMVSPTVLKIFPHIYHDIPHGTQDPPRYYTHVIQGASQSIKKHSFFFYAMGETLHGYIAAEKRKTIRRIT